MLSDWKQNQKWLGTTKVENWWSLLTSQACPTPPQLRLGRREQSGRSGYRICFIEGNEINTDLRVSYFKHGEASELKFLDL